MGGGFGEWVGKVVDDLDHIGAGAVGLIELDVLGLAGALHGEERGVGLVVVVIELPDEAGLCGMAHPGDDGRCGMEEQGVAAFVHGAIGLIVHELGLAYEVGEIGDFAVAGGDDAGVFTALDCAIGEVVLGPGVGDHLPIFFVEHSMDGFESGDGHGAGFGLDEVIADIVILARRAPVVRAVGADAAA